MREQFLNFCTPAIGEEEIAEVCDTLRSPWITTGPKVREFERAFAQFTGAPASLALSSCTAALHLALVSLGIGQGDAVVTSPLTFCSGINVIEHVGARPLLVDVEPDTLNLDPLRVRKLLEQHRSRRGDVRIKALMPVHLHGHPADLDPFVALAEEYGLAIIEDAAHSLPARYRGRRIGSLPAHSKIPWLTAFSFYATKNLTTAEGGMLTGPPALIDEARLWSLHGMSRDAWKRYGPGGSWFYEVVRPGFKCNMTDIQASLGLRQLQRLEELHHRRKLIVERYNRGFAAMPELQLPASRTEVEHAWHLYVLRLHTERTRLSRDRWAEELKARNIGSSVHFIPVHLHPYYRDKYHWQPADFPIAYHEFTRMLSLPLSPRMSDRDVDDVIEATAEILRDHALAAQAASR